MELERVVERWLGPTIKHRGTGDKNEIHIWMVVL